jgi:hypothetical protein
MEPGCNLHLPEKANCWDTFTFNTSTCTWDNDGTAQPVAPESELLGYFTFNDLNL